MMPTRRVVPALVLLTVVLLILWHRPGSAGNGVFQQIFQTGDRRCQQHPISDRIVVVVKTGATEAREKLPIILADSLQCARELIIVSDLEQDIGNHHLYDVLSNYSQTEIENNPEFDIYREQQRLKKESRLDQIQELRDRKDPSSKKPASWSLDKYKNLYALELAWHLKSDRDWYLFVDADTYVFWPNLLSWLASGSLGAPQEQSYWGRPFLMHEREDHPVWFAHGGSGYIISGATARAFNKDKPGIARRWETRIKNLLYGDFSVAAALDEELNVQMGDARPMVNNVAPAAIPFRHETWCQPLVTLHHMSSEDIRKVSDLEKRQADHAVRFADLYAVTYPEEFPEQKTGWQNMADDRDMALDVILNNQTKSGLRRMSGAAEARLVDPHASYDGCQLACKYLDSCVQFAFWEWRGAKGGNDAKPTADTTDHKRGTEAGKVLTSRCHLSMAIRVGAPQVIDPERDETWTSGWMIDRIRDRTQRQWKCDVEKSPS